MSLVISSDMNSSRCNPNLKQFQFLFFFWWVGVGVCVKGKNRWLYVLLCIWVVLLFKFKLGDRTFFFPFFFLRYNKWVICSAVHLGGASIQN